MGRPSCVHAACLAAALGLATGCAVHRSAPNALAQLDLEHGSWRIEAPVDAGGSILLTQRVQLLGHIDATPIFAAEGARPTTVQLLLHEGCYWVAADGFRNLWRLAPQAGTTRATYSAVALPDPAAGPVRMSRWGTRERSCVRLDAERGGPWFVRSTGEIVDACG